MAWREEAGMEGRGFPPENQGNGETSKTHGHVGGIEEGKRTAGDDVERCGQVPQPSDIRIPGRNGKGEEDDEAKKAKEGMHLGGSEGRKHLQPEDHREGESKEVEEGIGGEMEERNRNLAHEVPKRTEVEKEEESLDGKCDEGEELQTTDTEVEGKSEKKEEHGEGGEKHGESERKFSGRGKSSERVGLEEGGGERIPRDNAVMGSEMDDRNHREEGTVSEPMKQLELPGSQIFRNLTRIFVTNPIMSLQSKHDPKNLAKVNPKEPVNLCTKESFDCDEPSITGNTSKVYKKGETWNDSGVKEFINDDTSCIYDINID